MAPRKEFAALHVQVPIELYKMLGKLCIQKNTNRTEVVNKYLRWIQATDWRKRKILDETSTDTTFSLDD